MQLITLRIIIKTNIDTIHSLLKAPGLVSQHEPHRSDPEEEDEDFDDEAEDGAQGGAAGEGVFGEVVGY